MARFDCRYGRGILLCEHLNKLMWCALTTYLLSCSVSHFRCLRLMISVGNGFVGLCFSEFFDGDELRLDPRLENYRFIDSVVLSGIS